MRQQDHRKPNQMPTRPLHTAHANAAASPVIPSCRPSSHEVPSSQATRLLQRRPGAGVAGAGAHALEQIALDGVVAAVGHHVAKQRGSPRVGGGAEAVVGASGQDLRQHIAGPALHQQPALPAKDGTAAAAAAAVALAKADEEEAFQAAQSADAAAGNRRIVHGEGGEGDEGGDGALAEDLPPLDFDTLCSAGGKGGAGAAAGSGELRAARAEGARGEPGGRQAGLLAVAGGHGGKLKRRVEDREQGLLHGGLVRLLQASGRAEDAAAEQVGGGARCCGPCRGRCTPAAASPLPAAGARGRGSRRGWSQRPRSPAPSQPESCTQGQQVTLGTAGFRAARARAESRARLYARVALPGQQCRERPGRLQARGVEGGFAVRVGVSDLRAQQGRGQESTGEGG